jgi:uncharacterized protein (TIGR02594 family)
MKYSWMDIAEGERGVKEITGASAHPQIVAYHATTTLKATSDEVPWCSSFVNWVMAKAKYPITKSAAAKSWATYGQSCSLHVGSIVVFSRKGGHHVGFCVGITPTTVLVLGGNQSNEVNVSRYRNDALIASVVPNKLNKADQALWDSWIGKMANKAVKGLI